MNKHTSWGFLLRVSIEIILILAVMSFLIVSPSLLASTKNSSNSSQLNLIIDDIVCRNNDNTECPFILKKYYQNIGDLVDPDEIADAKLRLGTLQQIIGVRVSLEKSTQRGHVNVVFIVEEASQIQYSLSAGFVGQKINAASGRNPYDLKWSNYLLTTGVTNYNFLGTGKQLSFSVGGAYSDTDSKQPDTATISSDGQVVFQTFNSESNNLSVQLNYYDPHLFGSVDYFLSANVSHAKSERMNDSFLRLANGETFRIGENTLIRNQYDLAIGRRFASFSHISLQYSDSKIDSEQPFFPTFTGELSLNYGWDSRDDLLFPSKGSIFNATLRGLNDSDFKGVSLSYTDNIAFSDEKIFSYSISDSFAYVNGGDNSTELNPFVSLALSDIDFSDRKNGNYAGWKYRIFMPLRDLSAEDIGFGIIYTRQTNSLILKFSFEYQMDWGDIL